MKTYKIQFSIFISCFLSLLSFSSKAQVDMVGQIVAADYYSSELAANKGVLAGLKHGVDQNTIFFQPAPEKAYFYLKNMPNIPDEISWKPVMAKIAKSNEWGFTTGPMVSSITGMQKNYGEYLTVWKRNRKGKWMIAYRAEIKHPKPSTEEGIEFVNPANQKFIRQRSKARLEQREEIITSTDRLMGTVLTADNRVGYDEFLAEDSRLLFSGFLPIVGKKNIQNFLIKNKIDIKTTPIGVDRSLSGEMAFSYGDAKVIKDNVVQNFYYLRIWELNNEFKWNVLVEMLFEK
jgi:hypothetical protein